MVEIGRVNKLKIIKHVDYGVFLDGGDDGQILLPLRYMPEQCDVGDEVEVFVAYDSGDRLVALTEMPFAMVGEFTCLRIKSLERVGAFLDWGLPKDLFLPHGEQTRDLRVGQYVVVHVHLDKSDRISASMRLDRYMDKEPGSYQPEEAVELFIAAKTDLGYKAIINSRHWGMLYGNEVFQPLEHGQRLKGFIKQIRPDGKIDLSLQPPGHKGAEDIGDKILEALRGKGGFLPLTDKTAPETIYRMFGVSKKKYKMALGGLYKRRLVRVEEAGVRLLEAPGQV